MKITTPIRLKLIESAAQNAEHRRMPLVEVAQEIGLDVCKQNLTKSMAKAEYNPQRYFAFMSEKLPSPRSVCFHTPSEPVNLDYS